MKQFLRTVFIFSLTLVLLHANTAAQCPAGYTRDTLNWDYLDYLPNSADYSSYVTWDPLESTCRHASLSIL